MRDLDNISKDLKDVIRSLESYKLLQSLDYSSVLSKITLSNNQYDKHIYLDSEMQLWRLTAKSVSGKSALIDMNFFFRKGNADVMAYPQRPTPVAPEVSVLINPKAPTTAGELSWEFRITSNLYGAPPPHNVYLKFLFKSTDDVTWTMTRI